MQIFYVPDLPGNDYCMNEQESHHAIKVLRMKTGQEINIVDGNGTLYKCSIADEHPKHTKVIVEDVIHEFEKRPYRLHMAISPLKNADRFEWFLEKATEIGIDEITPLACKRTEKKGFNNERAKRIVESAMKQSLKAYCPIVNHPILFSEFISKEISGIKLIGFCEGERKLVNEIYKGDERVTILIGPEGDFIQEEIDQAKSNGYIPISLGNSRLRTETAGIVACHSVFFLNNKKT